MSRLAARTARRRPAASRRSRTKQSVHLDAEFLRTWLPPAIVGLIFLVVYFLGNLDVIDTRPALAGDAFLLSLIVLFFPMRYAYRLSARGRTACALLALAWIAAVFLPIYLRIYPAPRIATIEIRPDKLPATLPIAEQGATLDLVIEGHLESAVTGSTRAAQYSLLLEDSQSQEHRFRGKFVESWDRQARGRGESFEVRRSRTADRVVLENPSQKDVRVIELDIRGRAENRMTLTLYPHTQLPLLLSLCIAVGLIFAGVIFDRATGAGETAASLTITTAAALTATLAFQSVASPEPTFRELFGATIVGALIGGPIGGLAAWTFRIRKRGLFRAERRDN